MQIGVISDTHGLLRPEALVALRGSEHILHAGDVGDPAIGDPAILDRLREIAPVTAIRGNIDEGRTYGFLPAVEVAVFAGHSFYMLHDRKQLDLDPGAAGFSAVISGHSHKPLIEWRKGVLFLNPGSAGPRRFRLPVTIASLRIEGTQLDAQIIQLAV